MAAAYDHMVKKFKLFLRRFFTEKVGQLPLKHARFTYYIEIAVNWLQDRVDMQCSDTKAAGSFWTIIRKRDN